MTLRLLGFPNEYSQVLLNLLSNAKEAILARNQPPSGAVDIVLAEHDSQGSVSVRDNGGGIPADFSTGFSTRISPPRKREAASACTCRK